MEDQYNEQLENFLSRQPADTFSNAPTVHLFFGEQPHLLGIYVPLDHITERAEKATDENADGESFCYDEQFEKELFTFVIATAREAKGESERKANETALQAYTKWREAIFDETKKLILDGINKGLVKIEKEDDTSTVVAIGEHSFACWGLADNTTARERAFSIAYTLDALRMDYYTEYAYYMAYLREKGCGEGHGKTNTSKAQ